jgi:Trehalase
MTLRFPEITIKGDRARLLAPYRHGCEVLARSPKFSSAWEAAFATLGLRFAREGFVAPNNPFLAGLDREGYIHETIDASIPAAPLAAWSEWELFKVRADKARLTHALPLLAADFAWRQAHKRQDGLYSGSQRAFRSGLSSRFWRGGQFNEAAAEGGAWIDASCMMALNALCLKEMALALGQREEAARFEWAMRELAARINEKLWSEADGWYFDADERGTLMPVRSLASYWAIVSGVAPVARAERQVGALSDVTKFERAHPYSSLSASEREYRGKDGKPLGVARSDFNVLGYESLHALDRGAQADFNAEDHLARVARVLADTHELFEAYDPDKDSPIGAPSALTAALMINIVLVYVVGLRPNAAKGELTLALRLRDSFSIEGLPFAGGSFSIEATPTGASRRKLEVMTDVPFRLRVKTHERIESHDLTPGSHSLQA